MTPELERLASAYIVKANELAVAEAAARQARFNLINAEGEVIQAWDAIAGTAVVTGPVVVLLKSEYWDIRAGERLEVRALAGPLPAVEGES